MSGPIMDLVFVISAINGKVVESRFLRYDDFILTKRPKWHTKIICSFTPVRDFSIL